MTKLPELSPRELWRLLKPNWGSGEQQRGITVVILLIAIVLGSSGMMAWFTGVTKDFFDALDQRNAALFWKPQKMLGLETLVSSCVKMHRF